MNITEKILASHCGKKEVAAGEFILADVDIALGNDITAPLAIEEIEKLKAKSLPHPEKIVLVADHFTPNKDKESANQCLKVKNFAKKYNVKNFFELGCGGIEHALLPEEGFIMPGNLIIGADSHTCSYGALGAFATGVGSTDLAFAMLSGKIWLKVPESMKFVYHGKLNDWVTSKDLILYTIGDIGVDGADYKAMEFEGEVIRKLSVDGRLTMCNMAIEAGGKSGIIAPDKITLDYIKQFKVPKGKVGIFESDKDAKYANVKEYDVGKIEPQVAFPHLPSNTKGVSEAKNINLDQVVIGSCTNGRLEDLRIAAKILKGKKVHANTRTIIIPATQKIYLQALKEGLMEIFINAGAVVSPPTCGPCIGGHMGVLAKDEKCLATTNRNFIGRMGDKESEVYLGSPAVAAASAVKGRIAHPEEVASRKKKL
ncbi:MAG: 3-isopropylmalate dehydratase large subunit [Candidatus Ratteibacteria bacterium]|nr:3-isopropylmalate dehydratase large subunit [Candidatus Ratteibacteria bacterium]